MSKCHSIDCVYEFYMNTCSAYTDKGLRILKTDTHNEAKIWSHSPPLAPLLSGNDLTCIEINEQTLSLAQQNFPDIRMELGDVRTWVGEYDVILDFSTIDHFPDFDAAIENYKKLAPKLHCVVWLGGHSPQGDQYWHPHNEFRQSMSRYANVEETLLYADGSKHLVYFLAHDLPL